MSSFIVQVTDGPRGPSEGYELDFARRALKLLKNRLGKDAMMHLLEPDITQSDAYWERMVTESDGRFQETSITINTTGISVQDFMTWFHANAHDNKVMEGAHPEHYINTVGPILETLGDHPSFFHLELQDRPSACVTSRDADKYPMAMCGSAVLRSGTVIGHACHQFREYDQGEGIGFEIRFGGWMPQSCEPEVLETHQRHFAVEWTNWITAAHRDLRN